MLDELKADIKKAVSLLREHKDKRIRIISNFDADGISAGAILTKALLREGYDIHVTIIKQLKDGIVEELSLDKDDFLLFSDLGSGQIEYIEPLEKPTIILDHHAPAKEKDERHFDEVVQVNPEYHEIDEDHVSAAGLSYLFAEELCESNVDLSAIAIVGATGDIQETDGEFTGINKKIVEKGALSNSIKVKKGLRVYGRGSRPLHLALSYTMDPFIPGVSGDQSGSVQFLSTLDIDLKKGKDWRTLEDLNEEEKKKLAEAIIIERIKHGEDDPDKVLGDVFHIDLPEEFCDIRETSTALNACGRMKNAGLGVLFLLNEKNSFDRVKRILNGYRRLLGSYLKWVKENKDEVVKETDSAYFIIAEDNIQESMIGTCTTILTKSEFLTGKPIFGLALTEDGEIKISGRVPDPMQKEEDANKKYNLKNIVDEACKKFDREGGGHAFAAGGYIPTDKQEEFMEIVSEIINRNKENPPKSEAAS